MKQNNKTEIRTNIYLRQTDPLERELKILSEWKGSAVNKGLIAKHHKYLLAKGNVGSQRIAKVSWQLRTLCNVIEKNLDSLTIDDVEELVSKINQYKNYSEATKADYRRMIKSFFKWFRNYDERLNSEDRIIRDQMQKFYQYIDNNVKKNYKQKIVDYSNIINDEDAKKLIEATPSIMEKAAIALLHETGCRIGEFLGIRLKDIELKYTDGSDKEKNQSHAMIRVTGKTGERRIPVIQSLPYLLRFLDEHLDKNNPDALLWISKNPRFYKRPLHYIGIKRILQKNFQRIGLNKKCNCHWMRHSRATILVSEGFQEEIIRNIMGWSPGSDMIKTYVHIGAKQVENAFININGLSKNEERQPKMKSCVCGIVNNANDRYCFRCGKPLSIAVFVDDNKKVEIETNKTIQFLMEVLKDPTLKEKFEVFQTKEKV